MIQTCDRCGGQNIGCDAYARLNAETGAWELSSCYDDTFCHDCESECKVVERAEEGASYDVQRRKLDTGADFLTIANFDTFREAARVVEVAETIEEWEYRVKPVWADVLP